MLYAPKLSTRFEAQEIKETGTEAGDDAEGHERSLRWDAAQSDRAGNRNAFSVGSG
jgi:hypothetical protein